jgi:beta-N-acetylglucosaminidase/RNase P/RNase MRP subunit p29
LKLTFNSISLKIFIFIVLLIFTFPLISKAEETGWTGKFYPNETFEGTPVTVGPYDSINFNWGRSSPAKNIPSDHFSATFERTSSFQEGIINLRVWANDGVQVYVDGKLVIDEWNNQSLHFFTKPIYLNAGNHHIKIKYKEIVGLAELRFEIDDLMRDNRWYGMAFSTSNFSGKTVLLGYSPQIYDLNFDWERESPANGIPSDYFSTFFQRNFTVMDGYHELQVTANDGVQVYVDGTLIIDEWDNEGVGTFNKSVYLNAGKHTVKIKYKEIVGLAELKFNLKETVPKDGQWYGMAFSTPDFSGQMQQLDPISDLAFDWERGSPAPGIPSDNFSVIFQKSIDVNRGAYYLQVKANDGVKVYIDGNLEIDEWDNESIGSFNKTVFLEDGNHTIKVEYKEIVGLAELKFDMKESSMQENQWYGMVFPNTTLSGTPKLLGYDNPIKELNFNWGTQSPIEGIPSDYFSASFRKRINVSKGPYTINLKANDGVRVFVDDQLIMDHWNNESVGTFRKTINLDSGQHTIEIRYKEIVGLAELSASISEYIEKENQWYGVAYSNPDFTGNNELLGYDSKITNLKFDWGRESPTTGIPTDNFSTIFHKDSYFSEGAYNLRVWANDGVQVYVDGKLEINEWDNEGLNFFAKPVYLTSGNHRIEVRYKELVGLAQLEFEIDDLMRTNRWYGLAFSNPDFTGETTLLGYDPQIHDLNINWGTKSPSSKQPIDNFSAIFQREIIVEEGAYNLRVNVDDGVQVYVDGKLQIDNLNNQGYKFLGKPIYLESGSHTILIKYKELVDEAKIKFEIDDLLRNDRWYGMAFSNSNLTGETELLGYNPQIPNLDFNWGTGSPGQNIPADNFSTFFQRNIELSAGEYQLTVSANDGVQVYLDGKLEIDQWNNISNGSWNKTVNLSSGKHTIRVKHYEGTGVSNLKVSLEPKVAISYSVYDLTLSQMLDKQMQVSPQSDTYGPYGYVSSEYVEIDIDNPNSGTVKVDTTLNVRQIPINGRIVGTIKNGSKVSIVSTENGWHKIWFTWKNATREDVEYYLNTTNFSKDSSKFYQFLVLSESASLNPLEINNKILSGKGILDQKADAFIDAGTKYGINEIYLIAHALLETGHGTSDLANGVVVNGKRVYNMYGINAKDSCPLECGANYAYEKGWFTPEAAIIGGAEFIASKYIHVGQDTLYKMRWNPANPGTHQYATDIGWAVKQTSQIYNLYSLLKEYKLVFDVPKYK